MDVRRPPKPEVVGSTPICCTTLYAFGSPPGHENENYLHASVVLMAAHVHGKDEDTVRFCTEARVPCANDGCISLSGTLFPKAHSETTRNRAVYGVLVEDELAQYLPLASIRSGSTVS